MGNNRNVCIVVVVRPEGNHLGDLSVNGRIVLKWTGLM
jgi:hypothetical protein